MCQNRQHEHTVGLLDVSGTEKSNHTFGLPRTLFGRPWLPLPGIPATDLSRHVFFFFFGRAESCSKLRFFFCAQIFCLQEYLVFVFLFFRRAHIKELELYALFLNCSLENRMKETQAMLERERKQQMGIEKLARTRKEKQAVKEVICKQMTNTAPCFLGLGTCLPRRKASMRTC